MNVAQVFADRMALYETDERRDYGEIRTNIIGKVFGRIIRVTFTQRGDRVRIISARSAHRKEVAHIERKGYDMHKDQIAKAVLVDGKTYMEQQDGTLVPTQGRTDWARLDAMSDEEIEHAIATDPDAPPLLTQEWFERAELYHDTKKVFLNMRVDERVVNWFKSQGKGYQSRINSVLRAYVDTHPAK